MRFQDEEWHHVEQALREPEPWTLLDELLLPPPDPRPLRELAATLEEERAAAREKLQPLLESPERFEAARVAEDAEFQSSAVVEVLTDLADALHDARPQFALTLADAAVSIGMSLAAVHELRFKSLLGYARLARAKALFIIGRYREAEEELRIADGAFADDRYATEWDFARVRLLRSNVFVETHRLDDAVAQASHAARVFAEFGDARRYLAARLIEGGVLFVRRDYRDAARLLDDAAEQSRKTRDQLNRARARQTAGNCYIELGEFARAEAYLNEAVELWKQLGLNVECVRSSWSLGVLARARGDFETAIARIGDAAVQFDAAGVINDAAVARLELAEELLLARRGDEVPDVLRGVVLSFTNEGMMRNANLAVAYLREAAEAGSVETRLIRQVREYLEGLPSHPGSVFMPPP